MTIRPQDWPFLLSVFFGPLALSIAVMMALGYLFKRWTSTRYARSVCLLAICCNWSIMGVAHPHGGVAVLFPTVICFLTASSNIPYLSFAYAMHFILGTFFASWWVHRMQAKVKS